VDVRWPGLSCEQWAEGRDTADRPYDGFRTPFSGKSSPVLFYGTEREAS
jgi:hypothetical protein